MLLLYDFYHFYAAGELLRRAQSPYDRDLLQLAMEAIGWPSSERAFGFPYPPWTFYAYHWTAYFSFNMACLLWVLVSALAIATSTWIWISISWKQLRKVPSILPSEAMILVGCFFPVLKLLLYGQTTWIALIGLTLFCRFCEDRKDRLAGLCLSLAVLKPHLMIVVLFYVACAALLQRRWSIHLYFVVGAALQCAYTFLIAPDAFDQFFYYAPTFYRLSADLPYPSLVSFVSFIFPHSLTSVLFLIVGLAWSLNSLTLGGFDVGIFALKVLPISIAVSPYAWSHDFILLVPALVMSLPGIANHLSARKLIMGTAVSSLIFTLGLLRPGWERISFVFPLMGLLSAFWYRRPPTSERS